ncbi:hypothetical protein IE53DRAFT_185316 [Violaceomyces palustris]|uniref:Uncharacterized protein n=1 Tax=Violaceomyces palustris TaxID=1673888 RepID=A0ACD0NSC0_9BASI|nr:hypothetical protein IE53DRAFT_185316 [Violaceomyces palustris]
MVRKKEVKRVQQSKRFDVELAKGGWLVVKGGKRSESSVMPKGVGCEALGDGALNRSFSFLDSVLFFPLLISPPHLLFYILGLICRKSSDSSKRVGLR